MKFSDVAWPANSVMMSYLAISEANYSRIPVLLMSSFHEKGFYTAHWFYDNILKDLWALFLHSLYIYYIFIV